MPLHEFTLLIYYHEQASTKRNEIELTLRNSFKSFTRLKKGMQIKLVQDLIAYDLNERSKDFCDISQKRCQPRARTGIKNVGTKFENAQSSQENSNINMLASLCEHRWLQEHLLK